MKGYLRMIDILKLFMIHYLVIRKELGKLEEKLSVLPKTVIAVVGATGSGKSTLMNSLLDHVNILPTSGMQACTAVVVEVANNSASSDYEANIQFLEKEVTTSIWREFSTLN